jgi:hypothetical protein
MSTFKERLIEEHEQLTDKIIKLELFIPTPTFSTIKPIQQSLLKAQLFAMKTYSSILVERLKWLE